MTIEQLANLNGLFARTRQGPMSNCYACTISQSHAWPFPGAAAGRHHAVFSSDSAGA